MRPSTIPTTVNNRLGVAAGRAVWLCCSFPFMMVVGGRPSPPLRESPAGRLVRPYL